jgi:hypothetical protein
MMLSSALSQMTGEEELTSDDGVGRCDSWDYILDNSLGQLPSDTLDLEFVSPVGRNGI